MILTDLVVEVRDADLVRIGSINHTDLILDATPVFNGVGNWKVILPKNHAMAAALSQPGSGIVVTYAGQEIFSGPTSSPELHEGETPVGMQTFNGVSDEIALQDMLAWPVPGSVDMNAQGAVAGDVLTGPAETLMHQYVNRNIGPAGHASRRRNVVLGPNEARGATVTKTARFTPLLDLLNELGLPDGIGFRLIQRGDTLRFETYMCADLTDTIILSVQNGGITTQTVTIAAPTVTRTIVAGQGWATSRKYIERTNTKATAAEDVWGRRIERFVENSSTNITAELERTGDEALQDGGQTQTATQVIPSEWATDRFMKDWNLGDVIGVVIAGVETPISVKGAIIKADADGVRLGMALSDVPSSARTIALASGDPQAKVVAAIETAQQLAARTVVNRAIDSQVGAEATEAAQGTADEALVSANGKNANYYQTSAPVGGDYNVDDLWFDTDDGNKVYRWNGSAWVGTTFGNSAVANLDAGSITTGTLNAGRIAAASIDGTKLTATAIDGKTITGATIRTAASGRRWQLSSSVENRLVGYTGEANESSPGYVDVDTAGDGSFGIDIVTGERSSILSSPAKLVLRTHSTTSGASTASIIADQTKFTPYSGNNMEFTVSPKNNYVRMNVGTISNAAHGLVVTQGNYVPVGRAYRGFDGGEGSYTTNASSIITIPHDLGVVPAVVNINPISQRFLRRTAKSATNISVEVRDASTFALVGSGVSVQLDWVVFA